MRSVLTGSVVILLCAASFAQAGDDWQRLEQRAALARVKPTSVPWQSLAWADDPTDAFRQAKAEHRPIFLWVAGGRGRDGTPLERC